MFGGRRPSTDIFPDRQLQVINVVGKTIYIVESHAGANYYHKMGSKTKMYHVNLLKKYIAGDHGVDMVHTSNKNDATMAEA